MPENHFDERIAARFDDVWSDTFDPAVVTPIVEFLTHLGGDGPVLEFAVGTGRIALALHERGIDVHGIELSPAMVKQFRSKPGAAQIPVVVGDIATARVDGEFRLVYLVANTIMNLTTQDEQVECFRNAGKHLEPGGCFVVECIVPQLRQLPPGQSVHPFDVTERHFGFDEFTDLTEAQIAYSHHIWVEGDRAETFSAPFRYVWPSELDLMARLAGLTLRERWATWTREPFTGESPSHVSVWEPVTP